MEEAGYLLAKGDRGYIIVDEAGDHSVLSRNLGMKKKEVEAFMARRRAGQAPHYQGGAGAPGDTAAGTESNRGSEAGTGDDPASARETEASPDAPKQAPEASKFLPPDLAQKLEESAPALADAQKQAPEASKFLTPAPPTEKTPEVPAPEKPVQPPEDPELTALKKALAERHAKEVQKWADYNALELQRLEYDLTELNEEKAKDFAALQDVAMAALKDRLKEERTGLKGALNAIQSKLNPTLAAERAKERRREIGQLKAAAGKGTQGLSGPDRADQAA